MITDALKVYSVVSPFHAFILKHGTKRLGAVPTIKQAKIKQCFLNSTHQALYGGDKYRYFEGFVMRPDIPILIHHAWNVVNDVVLDLTLRGCEDAEYYGVEIEHEVLFKRTAAQGYYGIFSDGCSYAVDFIREQWDFDMLAFRPELERSA